MKKITLVLLSLVGMLSLAACGSRSVPAAVTDANSMGGASNSTVNTHAVATQTPFSAELASGPQQGLLATRRFYFAFNEYSLNTKYTAAIKAHARYLMDNSHQCVLLEGNTDSRGSRAYNLALGQKRAVIVAQALESDGVKSTQIRTISYGEERPVSLGNSKADYSQNRRTDLVYEPCSRRANS